MCGFWRNSCNSGVVGTAGFLVDTAALYAVRVPAGLYAGGVIAYLVAVTTTCG